MAKEAERHPLGINSVLGPACGTCTGMSSFALSTNSTGQHHYGHFCRRESKKQPPSSPS